MVRSSDRALYWVMTTTRRSPLLRQLDRVKSMIRYSPPHGTAGLARGPAGGRTRAPRAAARVAGGVTACAARGTAGGGAPHIPQRAPPPGRGGPPPPPSAGGGGGGGGGA